MKMRRARIYSADGRDRDGGNIFSANRIRTGFLH